MKTLDFGRIMESECWSEDYDLNCPFCEGSGYVRLLEKLNVDDLIEVMGEAAGERVDSHADGLLLGERLHVAYKEAFHKDTSPFASIYTELFVRPVEKERIDQALKAEDFSWSDRDKFKEIVLNVLREEGLYEDAEALLEDNDSYSCEECSGGGTFEIMWNTAFLVEPIRDLENAKKVAWDNGFCLIEHNHKFYLLMGMCGSDFTWVIHYARWLIQGKWLSQDDIISCLSDYGAHVFLHGDAKKEFLKYLVENLDTPEQRAALYRKEYDYLMRGVEHVKKETEQRTK